MEQLSLFETNKDKATRIWDEIVAQRKVVWGSYIDDPLHRVRMIEGLTSGLDRGYEIHVENGNWSYR